MHVGSVMVFQPPDDGFDYDRLVSLISARIAFVPRYRQRVRDVPGHLANPVWVDDEDFDVTYHVRRSALPRPGTDQQLQEFVARIQPRPLDRTRPLWEVYLVEGLARGPLRHRDQDPPGPGRRHQRGRHRPRHPRRRPDDRDGAAHRHLARRARSRATSSCVTGALADAVRTPERGHRHRPRRARRRPGRRLAGAGQRRPAAPRRWRAPRPGPRPPARSTSRSARARRCVMVGHRPRGLPQGPRPARPRGALSDDVTVNDVVLATVAGALRTWLLTRGEPVTPATHGPRAWCR